MLLRAAMRIEAEIYPIMGETERNPR